MKFYKIFAGAGLMLLASLSVNASAQSSVCTWSSVYGYTSGNYSYTSFICQINGSFTAASRTDTYDLTWGQRTCGSVTITSGYQNTGTTQGSSYPANCNTNIVATNTPASSSAAASSAAASSVAVCYTGYSQIIQTSPTPYPTFNPASCGPQPQCKYSVVPLDQHSYPRLKYTCL